MVDGWLKLGDIRCCTMTSTNEYYVFGVDFHGSRVRTRASIRYCEAVRRATLARLAMEQVEGSP